MQWAEIVNKHVEAIKPVVVNMPVKQKIFGLLDLTSLNDTDTEASVATFFTKAQTSLGHVAAVCIYPQFVRLAAAQFAHSPVKVATVVNFPHGDAALETVLLEISQALQMGAQEIDMVFPYKRYLAGDRQYASAFVAAGKAACGDSVLLKVILETGALQDVSMIADACRDALAAGADFVKTSTGKIATGATLAAATTMLLVIQQMSRQLKRQLGLKISGGIRDIQQAAQYIALADDIMGRDWVSPATFRIGASKLADELIAGMLV